MICPDCNTYNHSFIEYCTKCGAHLYQKENRIKESLNVDILFLAKW